MRINLKYLQTLVPFTGDIRALAELLESVGIEIDRIEPTPAGDTLEFDITPNRPDWLSHLGIAREVVAKHAELALRPLPGGELPSVSSAPALPVRVEDGAACPRYCGALLGDVRVEPSPPEVAALLESLGLRPINNLVDISNLVMMTLGQPLHFFDAGCLTGSQVIVRRARAGEKLVLLDQRELVLSEEALVIADCERPVALAGIMGGLDSGITGTTRSLFIESALFAPRVIRRTARRYGLRSDASFRYERGTDPALPPLSMALALHWLEKLTGAKPTVTSYVDVVAATRRMPASIEMDKGFPGRFSGMPLDPQTCATTLKRLCFAVEDLGTAWRVTAPSFRVD
ncbi:MAG TPA: phenylalanine--tRNA ligase beta subunit-related protein, partial [Candidatus Aminicenantes bacterium]|nr:phenylalanine--tRNA ligase beta subunit-related protein [Candidatus Aminicenantes bacterium]